MRKVELLPTRDCEAGYGPAEEDILPPPPSWEILYLCNSGIV